MARLNLGPIRERLAAASPGPWSVVRLANRHDTFTGDGETYPTVKGFRVPKRLYQAAPQQVEADADFMAHARYDMGVLMAEVARLRSKVRELGGVEDEEPGDTSSVTQAPSKQWVGVSQKHSGTFKELWQK
jgi:hypothetical protein